jgi:DNA helicase-2/ATP-dependent DNA helicase PcrA
VTLTTIHGAKGLEWEHVFLVNVAPKAFPLEMNDSRGKVAELDASGALAIKLAVDGRPTLRWYITQYAHDAAGIFIARPRSLDEEYRLFYVAVTRARDRLTITGRLDANSNESRCLSAVKAWIATIGSDPAAHALANTAANAEPRGTLGPLPGFDAEAARQLETRLARLSLPFEAGAVRQGALSFSAMDLHDRCPRRARYQYVLGLPDLSEDGTPAWTMEGNSDHEARDPRRFGKIVHKILELDALARIGGLPRDFDAFVADAVEEEGGTESEGRDAALAARAATAALVDLTPVDAERRFDLTINGVALGGYIDLLARDAEGRLVVIDYKTGRTSSDHYSLQFALYAQAIRESDGMVPQTMLLRISDGTAQMDAVEPASGTELLAAIAAASEMTDDSPKPGSDCRYCPYAHDVCRDAAVTLAY